MRNDTTVRMGEAIKAEDERVAGKQNRHPHADPPSSADSHDDVLHSMTAKADRQLRRRTFHVARAWPHTPVGRLYGAGNIASSRKVEPSRSATRMEGALAG